MLFRAIYLLAHSLAKVILVAALLKNQLWAYPWTTAFLGAFIATSSTRLSMRPWVG